MSYPVPGLDNEFGREGCIMQHVVLGLIGVRGGTGARGLWRRGPSGS
jgi:hypothetical protein